MADRCGPAAASRLDALWDAYLDAASRASTAEAGLRRAQDDARGSDRAAAAKAEALLVRAQAAEARLASIGDPRTRAVVSWSLGVAGTVLEAASVAVILSGGSKTIAGALAAAGAGATGVGVTVAVW